MKTVKDFGGFKLLLDDQGSGNEKMLLNMKNPVDDYLTAGFVIKPNDTVVDVGAHIGRFCIYAASRGARVYAYEPDPKNFEKLTENIKLNNLSNVESFQMAVNSTGNDAVLYLAASSSENTLYKNTDSVNSIQVPGITLGGVFSRNNIGKCDFLKMDCEGAEYDILFSLDSEIFSKIEKVALEYHDHMFKGKSLKDLVYLFSKNNFKLKIKRGAWYTGILYARKSRNVFFINYLEIYFFDLIRFCFRLISKKLFKTNKV